jgi:hypothetical protein
MVMVLNERVIAVSASVSFLVNFILHTYVVYVSLAMIPQNLLVAFACILFFPIWVVVIFGILELRKWGFELGLVISVVGVVFSIAGILLLSLIEAYATLVVDLIQICFCLYGLRSIKF